MALNILHSDGLTPIDAENPLQCQYSVPGEVIFVCDTTNERTTEDVVLTLPADFEGSVNDGVSWSAAPNAGIVSTTPVAVLIRVVQAKRFVGVSLGTVELPIGLNTEIPTETTPPSVPGTLTLTGGENTLSFNWGASTDNVGIDHYQYQYATDAAFTNPQSGNSATTTAEVTEVTAGTYYGRVRAYDTSGNASDWQTALSATTVTEPADTTAPTISSFIAIANGPTEIDLSWEMFDDIGSPVGLAIELKWGTDGVTYPNTIAIADGEISYAHTGRSSNTQYFYQLRVQDEAGNWSTPSTSNATTALAPPTAPTSVSASGGDAQITVTFSGATGAASYEEYHVAHGGSSPTAGTTPTNSNIGNSPYTIAGLTNGTNYDVYIRAKNSYGNSDWVGATQNSTGVTPVAPDTTAPVIGSPSFTATAASSSQINLAWGMSDNVTSSANLVVELKWGTSAGNYPNTIPISNGQTSYSHTGRTASTAYYYQLRVKDAANNWSTPSTTNATTQASTTPTDYYLTSAQAISATKVTGGVEYENDALSTGPINFSLYTVTDATETLLASGSVSVAYQGDAFAPENKVASLSVPSRAIQTTTSLRLKIAWGANSPAWVGNSSALNKTQIGACTVSVNVGAWHFNDGEGAGEPYSGFAVGTSGSVPSLLQDSKLTGLVVS